MSLKYGVYFVLSDEWKLYILAREKLKLVKFFNSEIKYAYQLYFDDEQEKFTVKKLILI
jgi:hypothetical protein